MNTILTALSRSLLNIGTSWMRDRKSYKLAVTAFFDDYVFYTRKIQLDKPHYEPTQTQLVLLLGRTKQAEMEAYNRNGSEWWCRYSILLKCYESAKDRNAVNSLMARFQIKDARHFIKWLRKKDYAERKKRQLSAKKHNANIDLYSNWRIEYPDIDYFEFLPPKRSDD